MNDHEEIVNTEVSQELADSFLEYSMSVIVSRALPDVKDGLKPVHRRILWSMYSQGMRPERGYNKCARATGDIMGKYHPHGDAAIYDALVRMAQPWSMRICLVDGHGNFGSLDDGPAAARYTECRLSPESMSMVSELEEDTVNFKPNYDGREKEPIVLPATFPNLLVNGSTGIAVGMATNMPPHNLKESIEAVKLLINNPNAKLAELMEVIPGPDFPTGGIILGVEGIREAYETGRGSFKIRAKVQVEEVKNKRKALVVTELPHNVGPEKVIARIKDLVNEKKLLGISDVKNYTDRKVGLRLVIEIKNGFTPEIVLDELFRLTPLEEGFSVSNVCLVDNQPRTLGIIDLAKHYIKHRVNVVKRRTSFRLRKAEARAHILDGLIVALASIEEVVSVIKKSKDTTDARQNLMKKYSLSEIQAESILEMTLRRLTSLEVTKLKDELKELKKIITELTKILKSEKLLNELVIQELDKVSDAFATPRRTELLKMVPKSFADITDESVSNEKCKILIDYRSYVSKVLESESLVEGKYGAYHEIINTQNRGELLVITSMGRGLRIYPRAISSKAMKITELVPFIPGEKFVNIVEAKDSEIVIFTKKGVAKKFSSENLPKNPFTVIKLKNDDVVVGAKALPIGDKNHDLIAVTKDAQLIRFECSELNVQGLSAAGVAGMKLSAQSEVIYFTITNKKSKNDIILTQSDQGAIKITKVADYPVKGRATGGVRCMSFRKNESHLVAVINGEKLVMVGEQGLLSIGNVYEKRDGTGSFYKDKIIAFGKEV